MKSKVFTRSRAGIALAFVCLSTLSCEKRDDIAAPQQITAATGVGDIIPCYQFDWETEQYMPYLPSGNTNPVLVPWASGASTIDQNIVADYKKVDGWELMYNTFAPDRYLNDANYPYFFALYNRYRGQLRFYLWQPATSNATSYVTHGLQMAAVGRGTHMLDYNAQEIINHALPQDHFSLVLNQQLNATSGTWLVEQYEIAYDANVSNTTFPDQGLVWQGKWINISTLKLNGTTTADFKGTLGNTETPEFNFGNFFGSFLQKGVFNFFGTAGSATYLASLEKNWPGQRKVIVDAFTNAAKGEAKGFFNGLVSGITGAGSTGPQPISMTMNGKIEMTGSMVANGGLQNLKLIIPGQPYTQATPGHAPGSNQIMGVFTISAKPVVHHTMSDYTTGPWEDPQYGIYDEPMREETYALDPNSFNLVWNPAVINSSPTGATIQNLKREVVIASETYASYTTSESPMCNCGGRSPYIMVPTGHGEREYVGKYEVVAAPYPNSLILDYSLNYGAPSVDNAAVRISFDVVPNSGAAKSKIVKTFWANAQ